MRRWLVFYIFFQAEDGIRDIGVTGVQTCALPIYAQLPVGARGLADRLGREIGEADRDVHRGDDQLDGLHEVPGVERAVGLEELHEVQRRQVARAVVEAQIGRASCRERVESSVVAG